VDIKVIKMSKGDIDRFRNIAEYVKIIARILYGLKDFAD
jgi:hypothetical protein